MTVAKMRRPNDTAVIAIFIILHDWAALSPPFRKPSLKFMSSQLTVVFTTVSTSLVTFVTPKASLSSSSNSILYQITFCSDVGRVVTYTRALVMFETVRLTIATADAR